MEQRKTVHGREQPRNRNSELYHRCFEEFREKWKFYEKTAARNTLKQTLEEERRVVSGIISKVFYEKKFSFLSGN